MKLENGKIDLFVNENGVTLNVYDTPSSIRFLTIKMTSEQFCAALGRLSYAPVLSIEIDGLDKIGKKMEIDELIFPLDMGKDRYNDRENKAIEQSKKHIPEGWVSDDYFRSQNSFFTKDGKDFARVTIRRWV